MEPIWIALVEVFALTDENPQGVPGFIHVVASAPDESAAEIKILDCLEAHGWQILEFCQIEAVDPDQLYDNSDLNDLIDDVFSHPDHVLLSTLHTYKVN